MITHEIMAGKVHVYLRDTSPENALASRDLSV
jgi:hypothetical protein